MNVVFVSEATEHSTPCNHLVCESCYSRPKHLSDVVKTGTQAISNVSTAGKNINDTINATKK